MVKGTLEDTEKTKVLRMGMLIADGKTLEGKGIIISYTFDNRIMVSYDHYEVTWALNELVAEALELIAEAKAKESQTP